MFSLKSRKVGGRRYLRNTRGRFKSKQPRNARGRFIVRTRRNRRTNRRNTRRN